MVAEIFSFGHTPSTFLNIMLLHLALTKKVQCFLSYQQKQLMFQNVLGRVTGGVDAQCFKLAKLG